MKDDVGAFKAVPARIPAGCCGLFGMKAQNGGVPTAPFVEPWHGLSMWGPITRRVADSALFYDAIKDGGAVFAYYRPPTSRVSVQRADSQ